MSLIVDNPIINKPFEEPAHYWDYREGQPILAEGRRPAGYYLKSRTRGPQLSLFEEEFVPMEMVNAIRERVKAWRKHGYPGITTITRQLLNHWNNPERERKLFFCQIEAAETLIYEIAAEITRYLKDKREDWNARHILFPQVLNIVWEYLENRVVVTDDAPLEEIALLKYKQRIIERLTEAIEPDTDVGESPLLPIIERFRPIGSTSKSSWK